MVNIAVLVSGGGTNLGALIKAQQSGALYSGKISLVVSNKADAYALERALAAGIEAAVLQKNTGETPFEYGQRLLAVLKANDIDMVVLAGFLLILDACVVRAFEDRIINVHPSLIPAFCGEGYYGIKVHEAALRRGVRLTGATVHLVNEIADGGRILAQKAVPVLEGDTPRALQQRVMEEAEWVLLPKETQALAKQLSDMKENM